MHCLGADRQAQQDSHTEIHQLYPYNHANSRHINNNKARKLKLCMNGMNIAIGSSVITAVFGKVQRETVLQT